MSEESPNQPEIQRLVPDLGLAVISKRALNGEAPIGLMERSEPRAERDSGWFFMAMGDTEESLADPENITLCDVNTIANIEPHIIPHLERSEGSVLARMSFEEPFNVLEGSEEEPKVVYLHPAEGPTMLTKHWAMTVPGHCLRRLDGPHLVIWRPGLTFWIRVLPPKEEAAHRLQELQRDLPSEATDVEIGERSAAKTMQYRMPADSGVDQGRPARWNLSILGSDLEFFIHALFDDDTAEADAKSALESVHFMAN